MHGMENLRKYLNASTLELPWILQWMNYDLKGKVIESFLKISQCIFGSHM